jgi:hypothetical protein
MSEVLLDREAPDRAALSPVAILKVRARSVDAEKFVLDQDARIADPPGDPDVLATAIRPVARFRYFQKV